MQFIVNVYKLGNSKKGWTAVRDAANAFLLANLFPAMGMATTYNSATMINLMDFEAVWSFQLELRE